MGFSAIKCSPQHELVTERSTYHLLMSAKSDAPVVRLAKTRVLCALSSFELRVFVNVRAQMN